MFTILNNLMLRIKIYLISKKEKRFCEYCNREVMPIKGVSVLNIAFYIFISSIGYLFFKRKVIFLVPIILSIINSILAKPRCPICKKIIRKEFDVKD